MPGKVLLSTAYLPPVEYFAKIIHADEVFIEREENYTKQTWRNRCMILGAAGPLPLTVPVHLGSFHKVPIKEIRIDYTKRWQQVHIGALVSSYNSAPFFLYYFDSISKTILHKHNFLIDKNSELTDLLIRMLKIDIKTVWTDNFEEIGTAENDFRYSITPKKASDYQAKEYSQVFSHTRGFASNLSIADLLFNKGPDSLEYLR